jgi:hypothetical protein
MLRKPCWSAHWIAARTVSGVGWWRNAAMAEVVGATVNYTVRLDDRTVFHAPTAAVFRIEENGTLSTLFDKLVPQEQRHVVIAGAREALRLHRERDPRVIGNFAWR